mmetsp:Transcript_149417/g.416455  ORF Transcript_149417/g.416455 Transcript_149417/m.416455 type:complete len:275 (+) Transcript_149417:329-1153(+)
MTGRESTWMCSNTSAESWSRNCFAANVMTHPWQSWKSAEEAMAPTKSSQQRSPWQRNAPTTPSNNTRQPSKSRSTTSRPASSSAPRKRNWPWRPCSCSPAFAPTSRAAGAACAAGGATLGTSPEPWLSAALAAPAPAPSTAAATWETPSCGARRLKAKRPRGARVSRRVLSSRVRASSVAPQRCTSYAGSNPAARVKVLSSTRTRANNSSNASCTRRSPSPPLPTSTFSVASRIDCSSARKLARKPSQVTSSTWPSPLNICFSAHNAQILSHTS